MQLNKEEQNMYKQFTPAQRASIDEDLASTARWQKIKWYVVGGIVFGLVFLGFMN